VLGLLSTRWVWLWVATGRTSGTLGAPKLRYNFDYCCWKTDAVGHRVRGFLYPHPGEWKRTASGSGCGCPWTNGRPALQDVSINILLAQVAGILYLELNWPAASSPSHGPHTHPNPPSNGNRTSLRLTSSVMLQGRVWLYF